MSSPPQLVVFTMRLLIRTTLSQHYCALRISDGFNIPRSWDRHQPPEPSTCLASLLHTLSQFVFFQRPWDRQEKEYGLPKNHFLRHHPLTEASDKIKCKPS